MGYKYIPLIIIGIAVTAVGLSAAYRIRSPWSALAALAALAGVITSIAGVLMFAVPNFFAR